MCWTFARVAVLPFALTPGRLKKPAFMQTAWNPWCCVMYKQAESFGLNCFLVFSDQGRTVNYLGNRHTLEIDSGVDKIHIHTYNCDGSRFFLVIQPSYSLYKLTFITWKILNFSGKLPCSIHGLHTYYTALDRNNAQRKHCHSIRREIYSENYFVLSKV